MNSLHCRLAALALLFNISAALAHDATMGAHEASRDPVEALLLAAGLPLAALADPPPAGTPTCRLTIKLVDAKTQRPVSGLVRVTRANGEAVPLASLLPRGIGLRPDHPGREWFALLESATVAVGREPLRIESIAGLEAERASQALDLRGKEAAEVTLAPARFAEPARSGWRGGNTHLHLRGLSRAQADEYLRTIPRADGLEMLFVSYLLRPSEDAKYISNVYTPGEIRALSGPGLQFGWGEEHRSNFGAGGEGFGHVLLLNLPRLIEPVSVGPGITGAGFDYPPLRRGMDEARRVGGTVIWCHNAFGFEDVPDWLGGRLHAHNIFDGGNRGGYAETFYRFLNAGLKVPFSTGTDWFIYDFARVYARLNGPLTEQSWLASLTAGRTFITNGPLLELHADEAEIGDTLRLDRDRTIQTTARATGRTDFKKIELVHNGAVIAEAPSRQVGGHFEAELKHPVGVTGPGWLALRVAGRGLVSEGLPPLSAAGVRDETAARNELDEPLFAHTSPIYLEFAGRTLFQPDAARTLLADLEASELAIRTTGRFQDDAQRDEVLAGYRDAAAALRRKLGP
ncbi:MAG TPA: CehA/McbA family metallohydrolase [Chthoniobacteraceae bacterium]|jgi:hypothetical protein|nr:CehA/McbA family metallohydrolase [Chthoniobacteraceae bacterium]